MYLLLSMAGEGSTSEDPGPLQKGGGIVPPAEPRARIRAGGRSARWPAAHIPSRWGRIGTQAAAGERESAGGIAARATPRLEARSPVILPRRQTTDSFRHLSRDLIQRHAMRSLASIDHQIHRREIRNVRPKPLSQKPFDPVPFDRSTTALGHRDAEARSSQAVRNREKREASRMNLYATFIDTLILTSLPNAVSGGEWVPKTHTASLFLPFRRRRFKTSRPSWVLMRFRNPWVRFRRRLLG